MNEHERAQQFNAELDALLRGGRDTGTLPEEDAALLEMAQMLAGADFSAESRVRRSLRAELLTRQSIFTRNKRSMLMNTTSPLRTWSGIAATLVLVVALTMAVPPLRTFAQDILRQVGLITFTTDQTVSEQAAGQPAAQPAAVSTPVPAADLNVNDASREAGFAVAEAGYVPAGFTLQARHVQRGSAGVTVSTTYSTPVDSFRFFNLTQTQSAEGFSMPVGGAEAEAVTVGDVEGLWLAAAPTGSRVEADGTYGVQGINMLAWERDGFTYVLQSDGLGQDEMIRIAESLR